jgi:hypothetical protein
MISVVLSLKFKSTASTIGTIKAVVAVSLIHKGMKAVAQMNTSNSLKKLKF